MTMSKSFEKTFLESLQFENAKLTRELKDEKKRNWQLMNQNDQLQSELGAAQVGMQLIDLLRRVL